jgi:hypothetical protein
MAGIIQNGVVTVRFAAPMAVTSNQPVFVADTMSLKRQVLSQGAQRWEISTNLEPSNTSADFLIHSVTNGYDQVFDIQMPQVYKRGGSTDSATLITVNSSTAVNTTDLIVTSNGTLSSGNFIKFSNHDKVYLVTNTVTSGSSSLMKIFPSLRKPIPGNTFIIVRNNVTMKARYDASTTLGISYVDGVLSDPGTVSFIEAI